MAGAKEKGDSGPREDAWDLKRAAQFLGISPRTLERYVQRRMVPCIILPPARVDEGSRGTKPMIVFDPAELTKWRDGFKVGRLARAS